MHINHTKLIHGALLLASAFLTACGGGGGGTTAPAATYTIGVTVNGLSGTLVLLNNGGNPLTVTNNGSFNFSTAATNGAPYAVTVSSKPALQTCTVSNSSGNVSGANINLTVLCATTTYTIGGTINNLSGTVGLHISTGEDLIGLSTGPYSFAPITIGSSYTVTVPTQPTSPNQRCTVANATGIANANVGNVDVNCVPVYTIGGTVTGLGTSIGLVLQNNNGDNLTINGGGTGTDGFTFATKLANSESYSVKVLIQPAAPALTCTVTGGSGSVASGNVTVAIACVTPIPQFAYVANYNSNDVSAYSIANGVLTAIGSNVPAGTGPSSITVVPSGKFAYVANYGIAIGSGDISAYSIDPVDPVVTPSVTPGALTAITGSPFLAGSNPSAVTVDPSGQFAYAANPNSNDISAYTIDAATGALTALTGSPFPAGGGPASVTIDHTGQFAYVVNANDSNVSAYTINAATGALTTIPCGGGAACDTANGFPDKFLAGAAPKSLDVDPTSKFAYVANKGEDSISAYTINPTTGALTQINCGGGGTCETVFSVGVNFLAGDEPSSIVCDPTSKYVYVANRSSASPPGSISAYGINATTGALTLIGTFAAGVQPVSITVDLSGQYVYVANNGTTGVSDVSAYSIDPVDPLVTPTVTPGTLTAITGPFTAGTNPASVITTVIY